MSKPPAFIAGHTNPWAFSGHVTILNPALEEAFPYFTLGLLLPLPGFVGGCSFSLPSSPGKPLCHTKEAPGTSRKGSSPNTRPSLPPWMPWAGLSGDGVLYTHKDGNLLH